MNPAGIGVAVVGGASGLGLASAARLSAQGACVTIIDLPESDGEDQAEAIGATFAAADATVPDELGPALDVAGNRAPLRVLVHTAGRGVRIRVLDKEGQVGSLCDFERIVRLNLTGSFNGLRLAAERIARHAYAPAKAGVVGMTLPAARDLAGRLIRVNTIAPGMMDTRLFANIRPDVQETLRASIPHPKRLGHPEEFGALAAHIIANPYLNGETIRLDAAIRMAPR